MSPTHLRLESAGAIIKGVIPTYPQVIPGYNLHRHHSTSSEAVAEDIDIDFKSTKLNPRGDKNPRTSNTPSAVPRSPLQQLVAIMNSLQRAVVLAHRGQLWTLVQNACRALWNGINCLVTTLQRDRDCEETHDCEFFTEIILCSSVVACRYKCVYVCTLTMYLLQLKEKVCQYLLCMDWLVNHSTRQWKQ